MSWNSGGAADPRPDDQEQTSLTRSQWNELVALATHAVYSPAAREMLQRSLLHLAPARWVADVTFDPSAQMPPIGD